MAGSNVVALSRGAETVEITSTEEACRVLQRELQMLMRTPHFKFSQIASKAAVCTETVSRLAYGETQRPFGRTVINVFYALGWRLWASRQ